MSVLGSCAPATFEAMRFLTLTVQAFLALNAMAGGLMLMLAPDGSLLQLPLSFLHTHLFQDFFWPGAVLFSVLGLGHAVGFILSLRRSAHATGAARMLALATLGWIMVQLFLTEPFWLQGFIAALAALELLGSRSLR